MKKKYAFISVFNKDKIETVCDILTKYKINIIATTSTALYINKYGYKCYPINQLTKFKEILDGRIKTLHHKIHASLLFKRQDKKHISTFNKLNFPIIDFVAKIFFLTVLILPPKPLSLSFTFTPISAISSLVCD